MALNVAWNCVVVLVVEGVSVCWDCVGKVPAGNTENRYGLTNAVQVN